MSFFQSKSQSKHCILIANGLACNRLDLCGYINLRFSYIIQLINLVLEKIYISKPKNTKDQSTNF